MTMDNMAAPGYSRISNDWTGDDHVRAVLLLDDEWGRRSDGVTLRASALILGFSS